MARGGGKCLNIPQPRTSLNGMSPEEHMRVGQLTSGLAPVSKALGQRIPMVGDKTPRQRAEWPGGWAEWGGERGWEGKRKEDDRNVANWAEGFEAKQPRLPATIPINDSDLSAGCGQKARH